MFLTLLLANEPATVHFQSSSPDVVVGMVTERRRASKWVHTSYGTSYRKSYEEVMTRDLCTMPCTRTFEPGFYEFYGYGYDVSIPDTYVEFRAGETYVMTAYPTSLSSRQGALALSLTGLALAGAGLVLVVPDTSFHTPGAGALFIGGGVAGLFIGQRSIYRNQAWWELAPQ